MRVMTGARQQGRSAVVSSAVDRCGVVWMIELFSSAMYDLVSDPLTTRSHMAHIHARPGTVQRPADLNARNDWPMPAGKILWPGSRRLAVRFHDAGVFFRHL